MAQSTLPVPLPSEFPQPAFDGDLITGLDRLVEDRLVVSTRSEHSTAKENQ